MNAVVVDVGNTRIKWGRCSPTGIQTTAALPADDPSAWNAQARAWDLPSDMRWFLASVHPSRCAALVHWAESRGDQVTILEAGRLPLRVQVPEPGKVGIDRLLDAVAVNSRRTPGEAAMVVDAGSAVTADLVSREGAFLGGVIFPGLRLIGKALHEHTALLPMVEPPATLPPLPAIATIPAIQAGMILAIAGGVCALREPYQRQVGPVRIFLTGGDAPFLISQIPEAVVWPEMTLEGIRLSAGRTRE
jgi:type III pantothenate kinase